MLIVDASRKSFPSNQIQETFSPQIAPEPRYTGPKEPGQAPEKKARCKTQRTPLVITFQFQTRY
jgi:hypothetical protein